MKDELRKSVQSYLHTHIPISQAMGITVLHAAKDKVVLSALFSNNINHKKTAFGGSLHAVATLACWSLLHINLKDYIDKLSEEKHVDIVITDSHVDYLAPVITDFEAQCVKPDATTWKRFMDTLQKKGKARIQLEARIFNGDRLAVHYKGTFAALKPSS